MTWDHFWGPNLLSATLFAAISAVVGTLVGLLVRFMWRKWGKPWVEAMAAGLLFEQRAATAASTDAVSAARVAADHAAGASADARTAADNSRQANDVLEWLVPQIAARDAVIEDLKERVDRLLGTRARQLAVENTPPGLLIPATVADPDDLLTETGRHRLHTQHLNIIPGGEPA